MEVILFTIGLAVFFLIPGLLILNWTGLGLHGLTRLNLAVITGIISSSLAYKLFGYLGLPWLTVVYFVLMAAVYLKSLYENRSRLEIRLPDAGTLLTYILFAVLIVYTSYQYTQIPSYSLNLVTVGDDAILAVKNKDALLHLSLVNEIARELPPTTPFISGMELKYHYGMDLLSAMFVKYLGFTAADAALRYMPIFAMSLALLSIFTLVREVGGVAACSAGHIVSRYLGG